MVQCARPLPSSSLPSPHLVSDADCLDGEIGCELGPGLLQLLPVGTLEDVVPLHGDQLDAGLNGMGRSDEVPPY